MKHEVIRASAGTGKTYQLTNRYLRLLRLGEPLDEILATTFTRKAAGEILDRVLLRLAEAATDEKKLAELQSALDDDRLARADCLMMLTAAARNLHRLRVGTLDSFFAQLAGSFSLELGLPPGWSIVEEHVDRALRSLAVEAVLDSDSTSELMTLVHSLTKGETSRSLERVVRDTIDQLYSVYRESDAEAWRKVPRPKLLGDVQLRETIETLRTLTLPKHKNWEKARAADLSAIESQAWDEFIKGGIAGKVAAGEESYCSKPIESPVRAVYETLLEHAKGLMLNRLADQTEATYQLLDKFHSHYQRFKSQYRALRFDDVTHGLARAAEAVQVDNAAFRLDARLRHLLLDEFQDTSLAQWTVLRPFAQRITGAKSDGSFFCVGDVKQAIYGWRGGVAEIFDAVDSELDDIETTPLDTSFRSSPVVINTVNRIFAQLHQHENLGELGSSVVKWQKQFNRHQTARTLYNGYACLQAARRPNDDDPNDQKQTTLRYAAEEVARLSQLAPGHSIGVLVRRNEAVRQLIFHLRDLGIDASEEGGNTLLDSAAVRVLLSLLQLADHPGDQVAAYHLETSPLAADLHALATNSRAETLADESPEESAADSPGAPSLLQRTTAGRVARMIRRQLMNDGYGRTIYYWSRRLADACNQRELRRLEKLLGLAYAYESTATTRPRDFLRFVETQKVRDPSAADVRVMTVHQSKGLQFDIVVVTELESDLIGQRDQLVTGRPSRTSPIDRVCRRASKEVRALLPESWQRLFTEADELDMAESLCVLYVAVTRAIHALHLIVSPSSETEKSLHKTFGGLVRAALTDGERIEPAAIAFAHGDECWYENPGVERKTRSPKSTAPAEPRSPLPVRLAPAAERRSRNLERVSPSGLEGGSRVKLSDNWSDDGIERSDSLRRGTLIHAWFEQILWIENGVPEPSRLKQLANEVLESAISDEDLQRLLDEFHTLLGDPRITGCLSQTAYASWLPATLKVENERPIAVREGNRLLVGNIDRLVTVFDSNSGQPIAADIVDFKTDIIMPGDEKTLNKKVRYYQPQLQAYRHAVQRITNLPSDKVTARLLFTYPRRVMTVDDRSDRFDG